MIHIQLKQFSKQNRKNWEELENSITYLHKHQRAMNGKNIDEFYETYQQTAQHLSYAQTYFPSEQVTSYLNELVAKAHNLLYKDNVSSSSQIKTFFQVTFIKLFLEQWKATVIAMVLFLLGALGAFFSILHDPLNLYSILPPEIAYGVDPDALGSNDGTNMSSMMSAQIMTNNIQVAILAFASGITFGILTVYLLIYNGIIVGALAALFFHHEMSYEFWAYIVPHGMIELTAIFIAGGAGLLMGYRLFAPGPYSRAYHLKRQAKQSLLLLLGTIPLFIIAGIIEGYITPAAIPLSVKYIVAFATVIGLIAYVLIGKLLYNKHEFKKA